MIPHDICRTVDRWNRVEGASMMSVKKHVVNGFLPLRDHQYYEIMLFTSGKARITICGKEYPIEEGALAFVTPLHIYRIDAVEEGPVEYLRCKFDWPFLARKEEFTIPFKEGLVDFLANEPFIITSGKHYAHVRRMFEGLANEDAIEDEYSELMRFLNVQYLYGWFNKMAARDPQIVELLGLDAPESPEGSEEQRA